jgi:hypothetical membrane protein
MKIGKFGRSAVITALASAGIVGPVLFWLLLLVAQYLHPGYDAWENSVSRLVFNPFGWLQITNFYILTLCMVAFGGAVYLGIAQSRSARIGSLLLVIAGFAPLCMAMLPVDVNPNGPKSLGYIIHIVLVPVSAAFFPPSALMLVPNLKSDERWRPFAYATDIVYA